MGNEIAKDQRVALDYQMRHHVHKYFKDKRLSLQFKSTNKEKYKTA